MMSKSNLDLVNDCDSFPYPDAHSAEPKRDRYYVFGIGDCSASLGYITEDVATKLPMTPDWRRDDDRRELIFRPAGGPADSDGALNYRNEIMAKYLQSVREQNLFEVLKGWRDELYPVYGPNRELLLSMERSATPLFGVVTYGVHLTAYVNTAEGMKIWTPKRAETKQTYPGMMDNTVAGGLSTGEKPSGCLIREAMEEASLPQNIAQTARPCGTLTYHYLRTSKAGGEVGLSQPEVQYIYDLELQSNVIPQPNDNEAIDFRAMSVKEVQTALADGKFKPNCALLLLEFFVRHGILTPENEPDYIEIVSRLHRKIDFPTA